MSDVGELAQLPITGEEREPLDNQTLKALELLPQDVFVDLRVAEPSDQRRPVVVQASPVLSGARRRHQGHGRRRWRWPSTSMLPTIIPMMLTIMSLFFSGI